MKIAPSNIFDVILSYFCTSYTMYYSLPDDQVKAFSLIMETLRRAAIRSANGKTPTLFIDGADIIANLKMKLFVHMLIQAKDIANEGTY